MLGSSWLVTKIEAQLVTSSQRLPSKRSLSSFFSSRMVLSSRKSVGSVLSILCRKSTLYVILLSPLDCCLDERLEQSDARTDGRVVVFEGIKLPRLLALVHELHHRHTELIALREDWPEG